MTFFVLGKLLYHVAPQICMLRWGTLSTPKASPLHAPPCLNPTWKAANPHYILTSSVEGNSWDRFFTYINNLIICYMVVNKANQSKGIVHWLRLKGERRRERGEQCWGLQSKGAKTFCIFSRTTAVLISSANVNCQDGNLCRKPLHRHPSPPSRFHRDLGPCFQQWKSWLTLCTFWEVEPQHHRNKLWMFIKVPHGRGLSFSGFPYFIYFNFFFIFFPPSFSHAMEKVLAWQLWNLWSHLVFSSQVKLQTASLHSDC